MAVSYGYDACLFTSSRASCVLATRYYPGLRFRFKCPDALRLETMPRVIPATRECCVLSLDAWAGDKPMQGPDPKDAAGKLSSSASECKPRGSA